MWDFFSSSIDFCSALRAQTPAMTPSITAFLASGWEALAVSLNTTSLMYCSRISSWENTFRNALRVAIIAECFTFGREDALWHKSNTFASLDTRSRPHDVQYSVPEHSCRSTQKHSTRTKAL